ncbi:carboxynorspermidine decarboxylase [Novosphingobium umbonatum]|uniref:Carboxynorspermidine/carboxyspermidine decarboxylase n=1 Tax=Novosphingobium umbonatum TaxID=1908524 RepID=A0A437N3C9_9SPHN|nr:carboxynorspermidine decarboxylase [Novosphingobium umbonatum]RVU04432.1 carboxynorspermidine decarboxylase [Novosphingobium umbonatum]
METRAGDPGAFAHFDLTRVDSPAFVVDEARLRANLAVLADVRDRSGIKLLAAMKAFSMWRVASIVGEYLDGVCTSGLWEARLARDYYKGEIATYCAGYKAEDMGEICHISDHVIFNSPNQLARMRPYLAAAQDLGEQFDIGLRINPLHREGEVEKYDPCATGSRLGFPVDQIGLADLEGVTGLHFHTLCEQDFEPLERTWNALYPRIAPWLAVNGGPITWLNFGGGHHITRADYQRDDLIAFLRKVKAETGCEIYLEPGEAVALDAGILIGTVLDTHTNGIPVAIVDISATCHMPDVIEAPYRPAMLGELDEGEAVRLGGPSCLAGDVIGDYRLPVPVEPGQRFAFLDQAHYSMVKTTTFNGVPLPSIWLWNSADDSLECVKSFDWTTFRDRLS